MMTECVRKFDEDISIKANKSAVVLLKEEIDDNFIRNEYKDEVVAMIRKVEQLFEKADHIMNGKFEDFKGGFDAIIEKSCELELKNQMDKYERVTKSFEQFFNQEDMGALIDRKADLELVRRLQETKATKVEFQQLTTSLENLNLKLKHISVLQSELANIIAPSKHAGNFKSEDDIKDSLKQREKLSKQAKIVCNWIYKEPINDKNFESQ